MTYLGYKTRCLASDLATVCDVRVVKMRSKDVLLEQDDLMIRTGAAAVVQVVHHVYLKLVSDDYMSGETGKGRTCRCEAGKQAVGGAGGRSYRDPDRRLPPPVQPPPSYHYAVALTSRHRPCFVPDNGLLWPNLRGEMATISLTLNTGLPPSHKLVQQIKENFGRIPQKVICHKACKLKWLLFMGHFNISKLLELSTWRHFSKMAAIRFIKCNDCAIELSDYSGFGAISYELVLDNADLQFQDGRHLANKINLFFNKNFIKH